MLNVISLADSIIVHLRFGPTSHNDLYGGFFYSRIEAWSFGLTQWAAAAHRCNRPVPACSPSFSSLWHPSLPPNLWALADGLYKVFSNCDCERYWVV